MLVLVGHLFVICTLHGSQSAEYRVSGRTTMNGGRRTKDEGPGTKSQLAAMTKPIPIAERPLMDEKLAHP